MREEPPKIQADPLDENQARELLDFVDVVRDPLHGDVRITSLERLLLDAPEMQRLRGINQLGLTHLVYPGALHNRFVHSIGTLHVCSQMIETCNRNAEMYGRLADKSHPIPLRIGNYAHFLARLSALLHDTAHIPFGHSLEKEGRIIERDEWQDEDRAVKRLLGPATALAALFRRFFGARGLPQQAADSVREELLAIFRAKKDDVMKLRYPFVHDLVGNTICADLIDYVQRDMYFCGLKETFGSRFMDYLAVLRVRSGSASPTNFTVLADGKARNASCRRQVGKDAEMCRVALLQYRYNETQRFVQKHDVIGEAVDLVRRRLSIAEKLYFHRTKIAASAMLISAFHSHHSALRTRNGKPVSLVSDLWDLSDTEALRMLEHSSSARAARLALKLRNRKIFKAIYRSSYHQTDESHTSKLLWGPKGAYERFCTPAPREQLVQRLEAAIAAELDEPANAIGTVVISCPDRNMNLKAFDMLVLPRPDSVLKRLQDSEYPPTIDEIKSIQHMHRHLWRLEVFVDPAVVPLNSKEPLSQRLAAAIQGEIGLTNEISEFATVPLMKLTRWERELELDADLKELDIAVTRDDFEELLNVERRPFNQERPARLRILREFLREKGYRANTRR